MPDYKYIIVGGGMTADAAAGAIRELDANGSMALFTAETDPPYDRPPLSKGLWRGAPLDKIWRTSKDLELDLHLGRRIVSLDPRNKTVVDDLGTTHTFDKLLLATGGTPRQLAFGGDSIIYFRTLADYRRLRAAADKYEHFAVIGGGFIGSEIAAALAMNGKKVTLVFPDETIGSRIYPRDVGLFLNDYYRQKGVVVRGEEAVVGLEETNKGPVLKLQQTKTQAESSVLADAVVAGIGILPNVDLAKAAGLATDNGILVDRFLRTSQPDIFAAGDVARFYNPALDRQIRLEHKDCAISTGRTAGQAMAGQPSEYNILPFFYSDLFELEYDAVGELDSRLQTVADWKEQYSEGVIYYLRDQRVCGVLLWNVWGQVDAARSLIAEPGPFTAADLKGRLPAA